MAIGFGRPSDRLIPSLAATAALCSPSIATADPVAQMIDPSRMAETRPVAEVGAFTSYDRTGGNDDGFSGRYSCLRRELHGCVIAELNGPGAITRIAMPDWPNFASKMDFYFDGERMPRLSLPIHDIFSGKVHPFLSPLAGHGLGGNFSYVPLAFSKSIKIVARTSDFHFYQINYVRFVRGMKVKSFDSTSRFAFARPVDDGETIVRNGDLKGGQALELLDWRRPGRIEALKIGPISSLAGDARRLTIRISWDDSELAAINVPAGDFFGFSFGNPSARSFLVGAGADYGYMLLPMPFARHARVELVSEDPAAPTLPIRSEIVVSNRGKRTDELYLHALWRRENPTILGKDYGYLDTKGQGQVVGTFLQAQGPEAGNTEFFEGDDKVVIDGMPAIFGTGSEDSFNGGWYDVPGKWFGAGSLPFSGSLGYARSLARTGGFRVMIPDAYSFHKSLHYTIEHGPEGNRIPTDYVSTIFYYLDRPGGVADALPPLTDRAVTTPRELVVDFSSSPPPIASVLDSSLLFGSLRLGKESVPFMDLVRVPTSKDAANPIGFDQGTGPPHVAFEVATPKEGDWDFYIDALTSKDSAKIQLRVGEDIIGKPTDLYGEDDHRTGFISLGTAHLQEGSNTLFLLLPERNPQSAGKRIRIISIKAVLRM